MRVKHAAVALGLVTLGVAIGGIGLAQDPDQSIAAAVGQVNDKYSQYNLDIKKLFAQRCSWCHQGYGTRQADGPKLAGTAKNREEIMKQIRNGKSPMPAFKNQLKDYEVEALADYIKALPTN